MVFLDQQKIKEVLCCPDCRADLVLIGKVLVCLSDKEHQFQIKDGKFPCLLSQKGLADDVIQTLERWDVGYAREGEYTGASLEDVNLKISQDYIKRNWPAGGQRFLELGCGLTRDGLCQALAGKDVWGVDISPAALVEADGFFKKYRTSGNFVCGDALNLPFKDNTFDFIYAGGTLEHLDNTSKAIEEIKRVLKGGGVVFATVPHCAIGMMTYGQLQGNIPNLKFWKSMFLFIHRKLFRKKFMIHGFEMSFTKRGYQKLFQDAGFKRVEVDDYHCQNDIRRIKNQKMKKLLDRLSQHKWFTPIIYVVAVK